VEGRFLVLSSFSCPSLNTVQNAEFPIFQSVNQTDEGGLLKSNASSFHFFAYLARMKLIDRWSLMRCTQRENVQEHSLQVAVIAHALGVIGNKLFIDH
jgi:hypothetical protein